MHTPKGRASSDAARQLNQSRPETGLEVTVRGTGRAPAEFTHNSSLPLPVRRAAMDRLLTAEELAERVGMRTEWIWAQARAGRIPHVRLGKYRRSRESAVKPGCGISRPAGRSEQRTRKLGRSLRRRS